MGVIIDAVLTPAEIDTLPQRDLAGTTAVVFDVLRATSSMAMAIEHGVREIFPVRTVEEARQFKRKLAGALLGGERHGDRIDGFDLGNSPLEYRGALPPRLIMTTTNGTIALRACDGARETLAGTLLNMRAVVRHVQKAGTEELLAVCAGTFRDTALEDVIAAGMLAAAFPEAALTDAAQIAVATFHAHESDILGGLRRSRNGRALVAKGRAAEVEWCAQISTLGAIGSLRNGVVRPVGRALDALL